MKSLLGILLILSSMNIVNAACTSYADILYVAGGNNSLTNIVVEGYEQGSFNTSHSVTVNVESIDYAGASLSCRKFRYSNISPTPDDDIVFDEFLKVLKLSMTLGYKLKLYPASIAGPYIVAVNNVNPVIISKP